MTIVVIIGVFIILLCAALELMLIFKRYYETGNLCPSNYISLGIIIYDPLLGYNLAKNFCSKILWGKSRRKKINIDHYCKGMGKYISTNISRYRGLLRSEKKKSGVFRIVIIGESTTFGIMNDDEYTWPHLLEEELNNMYGEKQTYEVVNLGVGGYKIEQVVKRYVRDYSNYEADLLINGCYFNDFKYFCNKTSSVEIDKFNLEVQQYYSKSKYMRLISYLWRKSFSFNYINKLRKKLKMWYVIFSKDNPLEYYDNILSKRDYGNYIVNINEYKKHYSDNSQWIINYRKYVNILRDTLRIHNKNAKLLFVCFPVLMSNNYFYNNPESYALPSDITYDLYNGRGYDSDKPGMVEFHAKYLAHSLLFDKYLTKLAESYDNCEVLSECKSIYDIPFSERGTIFCDEFHLTNEGNILFAKHVAKELSDFVLKVN